MIRKIDISNKDTAQSVLHIQIPAYQVEAQLMDFHDLPPLRERVEDLQNCGENFCGYFMDDLLVGALSYKVEGFTLDIHRLIVNPSHFRRGIGASLLRFVEKSEKEIHEIIVSTGAKNTPAKKLYTSHGFIEVGEIEVAPGVFLSQFLKKLER